ncbi:MAG: bifunctional diaminohydroxyphosphoribosylaminopyrimidine deaminase/5-amino-6-(5-phosphoribosylamino)uracil reductase RibD [Nitrospirae bacterium]|nr:bifunctional diaminohydroxyphosphoribosylaminopyrimidine deaminase/5-amino-6-(5-phosphoribosylamino)uracil reductase RibD [Nitrospirota bacterium]
MQKALALAAKGRGRTSPNPMAGAVIVKGNKIIAADYHRRAGAPHAEVLALKKAGAKAKGATLYINLEPCCHRKKKTPPCTKSIIKSGLKKIVIAMQDPNPQVNGNGIKELMSAGIEVETGIMQEEAKKLNEAFTKFIIKKEPFVILKIAQSIDGKIATSGGESKWITGEDARRYVHKLRSETDAVLVGIGTIKKDNPSLTCRIKGGRNPYRVVVDSSLQIPLDAKVLRHKDNKTIIAAIPNSEFRNPKLQKDYHKKINKLKNLGVQVLIVKDKNGKVDLNALMKKLGELNITSLMIEGGSSINASAISSRIVDKIVVFIAPQIIGGADAVSSIGGKSPRLLKNALRIKNLQIKKIGEDYLLEGYL